MKCDKCGEVLAVDDIFCTNCGSPIKREGTQGPTVNPMQQAPMPQQPNVPGMQQTTGNPSVQQAPVQPLTAEEENKIANRLSLISLLLRFASPIVLGVSTIIIEPFSDGLSSIFSAFYPLIALAAFVLMVIVRVKYPKNTFGKVLMWLYIATAIIYILFFVFIAVACVACISQLGSY